MFFSCVTQKQYESHTGVQSSRNPPSHSACIEQFYTSN